MKFEELHKDIKCDCVSDCETDILNSYIRKLRKDVPSDMDFKSHWERGIKPEETDCEIVCSYKGISVNKIDEQNEEQIINKYKTTFNINPKKGAYYLKFKIIEKSGVYKFTPEDDDPSHYNFLKSDAFDIADLNFVETVKFA